jgi:hypothetical protein
MGIAAIQRLQWPGGLIDNALIVSLQNLGAVTFSLPSFAMSERE